MINLIYVINNIICLKLFLSNIYNKIIKYLIYNDIKYYI